MSCSPKYLIIILLFFIRQLSYSQYNDFSVLNKSNINSVIQNPSNLVSTSGIEFTVAPIANTQFDIVLPFSMSKFLIPSNKNKYTLDFTSLSQHANTNNSLYNAYSMIFLYLSVKGKHQYWNFYIKEQFISAIGFDDTFFDFLNLGNKAFIGESIDLNIPINIMHYRNYTLSWAKQINEYIDIGFSGKLFFGKSIINIQPEFSLFTQSEVDYLEFTLNGEGNILLPVDLTATDINTNGTSIPFSVNEYLFGSENPGLGIDLGVNYKINSKLSLNLNVSDLGFIKWNSGNTNINIDSSFKWDGIDVSGIVNLKKDNSFIDDFINVFSSDSLLSGLIDYNKSDYIWYTPAGFSIGLVYQQSEKINFALNYYNQYFDPFIRKYFSATGQFKINEKWKVMSGLSFTNKSYFNLPTGIVYTNKRIRSTINLSNLWGTFLPEKTNRFGGSINMSFLLNYKKKVIIESDIDYPFHLKDDNEGF